MRCRELFVFALSLSLADLYFLYKFPPATLRESMFYFLKVFMFTGLVSLIGIIEVFRCYRPEYERSKRVRYVLHLFLVLIILPISLATGYFLYQTYLILLR